MSDNTTTTSYSGGIGFCGYLAIVFIVLKLTNVIDWTWFWVLSPILISWVIGILILIIVIKLVGIYK